MTAFLSIIPADWIIHFLLPATRALYVGSISVALGSALLAWWGLPESEVNDAPRKQLGHWCLWALLMAVVFAICWWPLITVEMSGASSLADALPFMQIVLEKTYFGEQLCFRLLLIVLAIVFWLLAQLKILSSICREIKGTLVVLTAMVGLLQPLMGHGATVSAGMLFPMVMHVLAATVWLGCLPGLLLVCYYYPHQASGLLKKFSWWGIGCVSAILVTALVQSLVLVGSWQALYSSRYGQFILIKCGLLLVMLGLASMNRFYWTSRASGRPAGLCMTLSVEIGVGGLLLLAAALLSSEPPPGIMGG